MNFRDRSIALRFMTDILVITLAFILAVWISHGFELPVRKREFLHWIILLITWFQFADEIQYYHSYRLKNVTNDLLLTLRITVILLLVYASTAFLLDVGGDERIGFASFAIALFPLLFARKYFYRRMTLAMSDDWKEHVVFVGNSSVVKEITHAIRIRPWMGYSIAGRIEVETKDYNIDGLLQELSNMLVGVNPSRIFIDEKSLKKNDLDAVLTKCLSHTVQPFILPEGLKFYSDRYQVQFFNDIPIVAVRKNPLERLRYKTMKRLFDVVFSTLFLLTVAPILFAIIALIIRLDSKGPVFFRQTRWGMNNTPFKAFKFRSMRTQSQDVLDGKYQQAQRNDPRITRVGAVLRKTNLDELPQFINVLLGDMSVVGPRPHPEPLNIESKDVVNNYLQRHLVKPGITGWAQVNGARGETKKVSQMQKRVDYDIWYIENWTFMLDIRIIFQTVWNMYKGEKQAY